MNMAVTAHFKMQNRRVIQMTSVGEFTMLDAMIENSHYAPIRLIRMILLLLALTLSPVKKFFMR